MQFQITRHFIKKPGIHWHKTQQNLYFFCFILKLKKKEEKCMIFYVQNAGNILG